MSVEVVNGEELSAAEVFEALLGDKIKGKISTALYYNKEANRKSRRKKSEKNAALTAKAKSLPATVPGFMNMYDQILAEAKERSKDRIAQIKAQRAQEVA